MCQQSRWFGVGAADDARLKLEAEKRAVNPCDHLRGAWAASSLYREKWSSQRGPQYDAERDVEEGGGGLLGEGVGDS